MVFSNKSHKRIQNKKQNKKTSKRGGSSIGESLWNNTKKLGAVVKKNTTQTSNVFNALTPTMTTMKYMDSWWSSMGSDRTNRMLQNMTALGYVNPDKWKAHLLGKPMDINDDMFENDEYTDMVERYKGRSYLGKANTNTLNADYKFENRIKKAFNNDTSSEDQQSLEGQSPEGQLLEGQQISESEVSEQEGIPAGGRNKRRNSKKRSQKRRNRKH
jgi:hypothetical protein